MSGICGNRVEIQWQQQAISRHARVHSLRLTVPFSKTLQAVPLSSVHVWLLNVPQSGHSSIAMQSALAIGSYAPGVVMLTWRSCNVMCIPLPGSRRVLSTSRDNTVRIWRGDTALQEAITISHNNNTGRWISPFRAVWGPGSDFLAVGSMTRQVLYPLPLWNVERAHLCSGLVLIIKP